MFNINAYYEEAISGENTGDGSIISYIESFDNIVLWGASYLGERIGQYLINNGIEIACYWDARAEQIGEKNGICVHKTFSDDYDPKTTVIILCIGNTAIFPNLIKQLYDRNYSNVILGDKLFMGSICPYSVDTGIEGKVCNGDMVCRSVFCSRLHNIVRKRNDAKKVFIPNITFMITTYCSLKCKYCVAYMNSYPEGERMHVPIEQIESDIDAIFDNVNGVGSVTIQGGEPFLHPQIEKIIKKILEKKNIGIISVATNGIFKISESILGSFKDERLNVAFSGYYKALPQEKLDVFYSNIEMLQRNGVPHTVGVEVPEWIIPPTLWKKTDSIETKQKMTANCMIPNRCMQVFNGKLYPCLYGMSLHEVGVADYPEDYLFLSDDGLEEKIKTFMEKKYYDSCGHCIREKGEKASTNMAGEQGFHNFTKKKEVE